MLLRRFGVSVPQLMLAALLWVLVFLMTGCAGVAAGVVGPEASRWVNGYCALASPAERAVLRASINATIAPHSIEVTCSAADPPPAVVGGRVPM